MNTKLTTITIRLFLFYYFFNWTQQGIEFIEKYGFSPLVCNSVLFAAVITYLLTAIENSGEKEKKQEG